MEITLMLSNYKLFNRANISSSCMESKTFFKFFDDSNNIFLVIITNFNCVEYDNRILNFFMKLKTNLRKKTNNITVVNKKTNMIYLKYYENDINDDEKIIKLFNITVKITQNHINIEIFNELNELDYMILDSIFDDDFQDNLKTMAYEYLDSIGLPVVRQVVDNALYLYLDPMACNKYMHSMLNSKEFIIPFDNINMNHIYDTTTETKHFLGDMSKVIHVDNRVRSLLLERELITLFQSGLINITNGKAFIKSKFVNKSFNKIVINDMSAKINIYTYAKNNFKIVVHKNKHFNSSISYYENESIKLMKRILLL